MAIESPYKNRVRLSTAFDPAIYEVFFNVSTGRKDSDISLRHHRHEMTEPRELDELQQDAEKWTQANYHASDWEGETPRPKWKFHKRTPRTVQYITGISDGTVLILICQTIQ